MWAFPMTPEGAGATGAHIAFIVDSEGNMIGLHSMQ